MVLKKGKRFMDQKATFCTPLLISVAVLLSSHFTQAAHAYTVEASKDRWTKVNQYSPLEGYYSQGSFGWHLGMGAISVADYSHRDAALEEKDTVVPRLFINKGTAWPVDLGLAASYLEQSKSWQYGGHIQWTIFEGFQIPSLAVRYSRSNLSKTDELEGLDTDALTLGTSYGFLRYLSVSVAYGIQQERGSLRKDPDALSLLENVRETDWKEQRRVHSWGISIMPLTPFFRLSFEQIYWENSLQTSFGKLSYML
jgi:hypothetical protein